MTPEEKYAEEVLTHLEESYLQLKIANNRLNILPESWLKPEQELRWASVMDKLQDIING